MEDPMVFQWMEEARATQNNLCNIFGRKLYDEVSNDQLTHKISVAIFGYGKDNGTEYSKDQMDVIDKIVDQICNEVPSDNEKFYLNVTYILIKAVETHDKYLQLVFRFGEKKNGRIDDFCFIDTRSRVYFSWEEFLNSNKLPPCAMCYPKGGRYNKSKDGICEIDFSNSHAYNTNICLKIADMASQTSSVVGLGVLGLSLMVPVALPIVVGAEIILCAGNVYSAGKAACALADMYTHKESISLGSSEGRHQWFMMFTSSAGALASGANAVAKMTKTFKCANVARIINVSSFCIAGVNAINGVIDIIFKCINGQLEREDIIKFAKSCLFLFNAVISLEMADRLIQELTYYHPNTIGLFGTFAVDAALEMTSIVDPTENYYALLTLLIGVPVASLNLGRMQNEVNNIALKLRAFRRGDITFKRFALDIGEDLVAVAEEFKETIEEISNYCLKWMFSLNPRIRNAHFKKIKGNVVPNVLNIEVLHQVSTVIRQTVQHVSSYQDNEESLNQKHKKIMRLMTEFDTLERSSNLCEFNFKLGFFCEHFKDKFNKLKEKYENDLDIAFEINSNLDEEEYKLNKGITEDLNDYFFNKAREFTPKEFKTLHEKYKKYTDGKSVSNSYFKEFGRTKTVTFCYSEDSKFENDFYFSYATEFAAMEFNEKNSVVKKEEQGFVILDPLPGNDVPRVLFYTPSDNDFNFGIAIIEGHEDY